MTNEFICTLYAYDLAHPAPWMAPLGKAPVNFYDTWRTPFNNTIGLGRGVKQSDYTVDGIHPNDAGHAQMRDPF